MWCPSCRAEVAAELSTDNRRMLCARCQTELAVAATGTSSGSKAPGTAEMERDARELLSRWSSQSLLEPPALMNPSATKAPTASESLLPKFDAPVASSAPVTPSPSIARKKNEHLPTAPQAADSRQHLAVAAQHPEQASVLHETHEHVAHHAIPSGTRRRTGLFAFVGQICAYSGVALLTVGSVLVMWSLFGGPANYMPTGWLTAAVGQMLLFLGVVTLISSGMEQTIAEVTWRIDHLAEEVHHMGLALDNLEHEQRIHRLGATGNSGHLSDDTARKAA